LTSAVGHGRSISVFVPAHNEVMNLDGAIRDIVGAAEGAFADYEILLVDDGSTDGTDGVATRLADENRRVTVITNETRRGVAASCSIALSRATKQYFVFVPGDREVSPASIRAIFEAVGSAPLIVCYHRNREARPWHRRAMTTFCTTLLNTLLQRRLRYYQGPVVYPTELARRLPVTTTGFFFLAEMLAHALDEGCGYVEIGFVHEERAFGKSKAVSVFTILMALSTILRLWWVLRVRRLRPAAGRSRLGDPGAGETP
jgi:glycosyltransferase involved in cell wall biosynthesis